MSVAQIGEFSFIIASVGVAGGAIDPLLYSMAIAVSAITTLLTPWLIRAAPATAAWVDRKLPRSIQTFAALYSSWIERLGSHRSEAETAPIRRAIRWLTVDAHCGNCHNYRRVRGNGADHRLAHRAGNCPKRTCD